MSWARLLEEKTALATALDLVGNRWTLMIITGCIAGYRRFNQIESHLGINRNLLKSNLDRLVAAGILSKQPYKEGSKQFAYIPTKMCMDLRPIIVGLAAWGEEYLTKDGTPITYVHDDCNVTLTTKIYCKACDSHVCPQDVTLKLGADAGELATKIVDISS